MTTREKELEKALRRLCKALWNWNVPPSKAVNNAYIAADNLLAKISIEKIKAKSD